MRDVGLGAVGGGAVVVATVVLKTSQAVAEPLMPDGRSTRVNIARKRDRLIQDSFLSCFKLQKDG